MSLTSALSNAKSGLTAASRSAEVISNNVANATTTGYGRQEIRLISNSTGGVGSGVTVDGINRIINQSAINDRRLSEAALGAEVSKTDFFRSLGTVLGQANDPNSITSNVAEIEASLTRSISSPENESLLGEVFSNIKDLTSKVNSASNAIKRSREEADANIASSVQTLNTTLTNISELNNSIKRITLSSGNANGLMDERQRLIDEISSILPIKEVPGENNTVRLLTPNGTTLVDKGAAQFSFSRTSFITPDMTIASGALSGLSITGVTSTVSNAAEIIEGGSLAAQFYIRDELSVQAQANLDKFSEELVTRFSDPSLDSTLMGTVGIFSDQGATITPGNEVGLAGRLQANPALDPSLGGFVWKLRDGIGAAAQGPVGNSAVLSGMLNLFQGKDTDGSQSTNIKVSSDATSLVTENQNLRISSEQTTAYLSANITAFSQIELEDAVDTDQELQKLLLVEQSYAANAQILRTIDEMLQSLLRI